MRAAHPVRDRHADRDAGLPRARSESGAGPATPLRRPGEVLENEHTRGRGTFAPLAVAPGSEAQVPSGFLTIDGARVTDMSEGELRERLTAPEDGVLDIELRGLDGASRQVSIRPDSLVDPTVRHARMVDEDRRIGYISILSFSRQTPSEFDRAFRFLEDRGMQALILDLRRNFGGVLESAEEIAERFVPAESVIVSIEGRGEPEIRRADAPDVAHAGFPLVVLVDGDSASASEVLAGALQDHRVAVVTGSPTYGKGMVQKIRRFRRARTRAKVTSAYYYSPSHRNFERTADPDKEAGILPDVSIPIADGERRAIHGYLSRYSPPVAAIPAIEAWERTEGTRLIEHHPPDPQLDAALALLAGHRPGPHVARKGI